MINIIHIHSGVVTPNLFIKPQNLYTKSSPLLRMRGPNIHFSQPLNQGNDDPVTVLRKCGMESKK